MNIIAVPAIAAVTFAVISIIKRAVGSNEKFERFIPLIAAAIGGDLRGNLLLRYAERDPRR